MHKHPRQLFSLCLFLRFIKINKTRIQSGEQMAPRTPHQRLRCSAFWRSGEENNLVEKTAKVELKRLEQFTSNTVHQKPKVQTSLEMCGCACGGMCKRVSPERREGQEEPSHHVFLRVFTFLPMELFI